MLQLKYLYALDNGFSVMVCIPRTIPHVVKYIDVTKLVMHCYLTTEKLGNTKMQGHIAKLVQTFAEGIGCAHLDVLIKDSVDQEMSITTHEAPKAVEDHAPLIPKAEKSHPNFYKFVGMPPGALRKRLDAIDDAEFDSIENDIDWALIGDTSDLAEEALQCSASVNCCACVFCLLTHIRLL